LRGDAPLAAFCKDIGLQVPPSWADRNKLRPRGFSAAARVWAGAGIDVAYFVPSRATTNLKPAVAISAAGFAGSTITFVNYIDELPFFVAEVLPRQEARGWAFRSRS